MKWWIVVVMLAACGGKKDDTPAAADLSKVTAKTPPTVLDEARRIIEAKRDASSLVLLAHAQAAAKRPEAKATLDAGILAARADASAAGVVALVRAVDVLVALDSEEGARKITDEAIARIEATPALISALAVILSPEVALEYAPAIEKLATLAVAGSSFTGFAIRAVEIDSPAWNALVTQARLLEPATRALKLQDLATRARHAGASTVAKQLAGEAAQLVLDRKADVDVFSLALEVALAGDAETAKKLVAGVAKQAHSEEAGERAIWLASLAEIYAVAGDAAGSAGFEKKALIAADRGSDDLDEPDPDQDGKIGDQVWASLVLARFARRAVDPGLELLDEHATQTVVEDVARAVVDHGDRALLPRVTERLKDEPRKQALADLVAGESRVDPDLAARALARKGDCMQAIVRSKDVTATKGACLAVIARFCPDSPLAAATPVAPSSSPVDEAKRILATSKHRDPDGLVLLARAQVVANQQGAAKTALADGLAAARADKTSNGAEALVRGVEVTEALGDVAGASKLLDEAIVRVQAAASDELIGTLLSPYVGLEHPATIQRLAVLAAQPKMTARAVERIQVGSAAWTAVLVEVKKTGDATGLEALARRAVAAGEMASAKELIAAAIPKLAKTASPVGLAQLSIRVGDAATARKLLAKIVDDDALLAELYAALGDTAKSLAAEKSWLAHASEHIDDVEMRQEMQSSIATARALRKDVDGATAYMKDVALNGAHAGDVAYILAMYGDRKAAELVMSHLDADAMHETITALVRFDVERGEIEAGKKRALESPMHRGEMPGIDWVLRAYATRGDAKAIRELAPAVRGSFKGVALDAFTDLAARVLAKQGKCDEALAAARDVTVNLGPLYAVIARYCPNSRL